MGDEPVPAAHGESEDGDQAGAPVSGSEKGGGGVVVGGGLWFGRGGGGGLWLEEGGGRTLASSKRSGLRFSWSEV